MNYSQTRSFGFPAWTKMVKALAIFNIATWFLFVLVVQQFFLDGHSIFTFLGLVPNLVFEKFFIWQPLTYMFLHAGGVFHILFNLIALWMFGAELEKLWGPKFFLIYYLVCGVGASLIYLLTMFVLTFFSFENIHLLMNTPVVGASGAIFGLIVAYGWIFKNRIIYVMLFIPMKASTFAIVIAGVEVLNMLQSRLGGPVSNLAHLGGAISAVLFLIFWGKWYNITKFLKKKRFSRLKVVGREKNSNTWN